jgi:hypothetical protein
MEPSTAALGYLVMPDFPIDPELRIRATPPIVLRRTTQALDFIRKLALSSSDRAWRDLLQSFESARDEWSAMEAVVKVELLLEAEGLLIEEETAYASRSDQARSRAA